MTDALSLNAKVVKGDLRTGAGGVEAAMDIPGSNLASRFQAAD